MRAQKNQKKMMASTAPGKNQAGSSLLEGLIAILIFSMGILALMGLQAASIQQSIDAKYRSDASFLANQILGQMWIDKNQLSSYVGTGYTKKETWLTRVQNTLPNSNGTIALSGNEVTVTVTWQLPNQASPHQHVAIAQVNTN